MAVTAFATGDATTEKLWASDTIKLGMDRSFFEQNGMVGTNKNNIVIKYDELKKQKGDLIHLTARGELNSAGITGDSVMEANEEALPFYDETGTIDQLRNAVRIGGAMTIQRTSINIRTEARDALSDWLANKITSETFTAFTTSPTRALYGGAATSKATIAAGDYQTTTLLSKASTVAKKSTPEIKPVEKDGQEVYVCVMAPDSGYDLRISDSVWGQAMREAMPPGLKNPLFTKSLGKWHDVLCFEHKYVTIGTNAGSGANLPYANNVFLGRGACAWLFAKERFWREKSFDYENSPGVCIGAIYGVTKLVYNSEDNAVILLAVYRTSNAETTYP